MARCDCSLIPYPRSLQEILFVLRQPQSLSSLRGAFPVNTRPRLQALVALGLVVQIGPDVYAEAGYQGPCVVVAGSAALPLSTGRWFKPQPSQAGLDKRRDDILLALWTALRATDLAERLGRPVGSIVAALRAMHVLGLVEPRRHRRWLRWDRVVARGSERLASEERPARPQPIRDRIMGYLATPRAACEVAQFIGRSVPNATGHLAAMQRQGLVRRLGYGAYGPASYDGPPLRWSQRELRLVEDVQKRSAVRNPFRQPSHVPGGAES